MLNGNKTTENKKANDGQWLLHHPFKSNDDDRGGLESTFCRMVELKLKELESENPGKSPLWYRIYSSMMLFTGSLAGLPWIDAAGRAARILPAIEPVLRIYFQICIVVAIGFDGAWVMHEVAKMSKPEPRSDVPVVKRKVDRYSYRYTRGCVVTLLALLSVTASVYGTVVFNTGNNKLWAVLTAIIGFLGYGIFGFNYLIHRASDFWWRRYSRKQLVQLKDDLIYGIGYCSITREILQETDTNINVTKRLITFLEFGYQYRKTLEQQQRTRFVELGFSLLLSFLASMVSVILAYHAWQRIWREPAFYYLLTTIAETPSFVVSVISTYDTICRISSSIKNWLCSHSNDGQDANLVQQLYHSTSWFMSAYMWLNILAWILAVGAPSAAGEIAYDTLGSEHNWSSQWRIPNVVFIAAARLTLSNFTINRLGRECLLLWNYRRHQPEIKNHKLLVDLQKLLQKGSPEMIHTLLSRGIRQEWESTDDEVKDKLERRYDVRYVQIAFKETAESESIAMEARD